MEKYSMRIIILMLMTVSFSAAAGEIYKCERDGKVAYIDTPCKTVDSQVIKQPDEPDSASVQEAKERAELEKAKANELQKNRPVEKDARTGVTGGNPTSASEEGGAVVGADNDRVRPINPNINSPEINPPIANPPGRIPIRNPR